MSTLILAYLAVGIPVLLILVAIIRECILDEDTRKAVVVALIASSVLAFAVWGLHTITSYKPANSAQLEKEK